MFGKVVNYCVNFLLYQENQMKLNGTSHSCRVHLNRWKRRRSVYRSHPYTHQRVSTLSYQSCRPETTHQTPSIGEGKRITPPLSTPPSSRNSIPIFSSCARPSLVSRNNLISPSSKICLGDSRSRLHLKLINAHTNPTSSCHSLCKKEIKSTGINSIVILLISRIFT